MRIYDIPDYSNPIYNSLQSINSAKAALEMSGIFKNELYTLQNMPIVNSAKALSEIYNQYFQNTEIVSEIKRSYTNPVLMELNAQIAQQQAFIREHVQPLVIPMQELYSFIFSQKRVFDELNLIYSNYAASIPQSNLDSITESIQQAFASQYKISIYDIPYRKRSKLVERELNKLSSFTSDERSYILAGAESIRSSGIAGFNFDLTDKIKTIAVKYLPQLSLKNIKASTVMELISLIVGICMFYYSHTDAVIAHQDAVQAHQDALIQQKQDEQKIKLLTDISEQQKELLQVQKAIEENTHSNQTRDSKQ